MKCTAHPGGAIDLPDADFYPSDHGRVSALCKECRKRQAKERGTAKRNGTYTPKPQRWAPRKPSNGTVASDHLPVLSVSDPGRFVKIGGYYIAESAVLIADTLQDGKVVLFTTILEVDGETKHPRNKRLIFTRQTSAEEYHATLAWLSAVSGTPPAGTTENERAAMQLAEEAMAKYKDAQARIAELEAVLAPLKSLLGKV